MPADWRNSNSPVNQAHISVLQHQSLSLLQVQSPVSIFKPQKNRHGTGLIWHLQNGENSFSFVWTGYGSMLVIHYRPPEITAGPENGQSGPILSNFLISFCAEWPLQVQAVLLSRIQCRSSSLSLTLGLQRCSNTRCRLLSLSQPNANEWKGFTGLKMKCYTIPFQLTKIVAESVTNCATKTSSFAFWYHNTETEKQVRLTTTHQAIKITQQDSCDHSLPEHSTSTLLIWFIHHKIQVTALQCTNQY